jgi:hypothetical protein
MLQINNGILLRLDELTDPANQQAAESNGEYKCQLDHVFWIVPQDS